MSEAQTPNADAIPVCGKRGILCIGVTVRCSIFLSEGDQGNCGTWI